MEKFEIDQLMKDAYSMGCAFAYDGHDLQYSLNKFKLDNYPNLSEEVKASILAQFQAGFEYANKEVNDITATTDEEMSMGSMAA